MRVAIFVPPISIPATGRGMVPLWSIIDAP
jgi:hypothetical protein